VKYILILATGSSMVASMVKTAWDRDEAWFKFVAPTERCFVAALRGNTGKRVDEVRDVDKSDL